MCCQILRICMKIVENMLWSNLILSKAAHMYMCLSIATKLVSFSPDQRQAM